MKSIQFLYKISNIDDDLILEAEKSTYIRRKKSTYIRRKKSTYIRREKPAFFSHRMDWRRAVSLAACLVLLIGSLIAVPEIFRQINDFIRPYEKTYASINDIPVTSNGINYVAGYNGGGPVSLMEVDGVFYFSYMTRWAGNETTRETVEYYTLFRYNKGDNSCTTISDEVGYIYFKNDRFIYTKTDKFLTDSNRWDVEYYTNNARWNNEVEISGGEARELLTAKTYNIKPDFSGIMKDTPVTNAAIEEIAGTIDGKVYFTASFNTRPDKFGMEFFCIGNDNTGLTLITSDLSTHEIGSGAFIGKDGFVYYHYRGDTSYIMKVDPKDNKAQIVATINAYVWNWVTDGKHFLCKVRGAQPYLPAELKFIK
ncbi:MAG: hypothetical protein ACYCYI_11810 [Saccharofermentanales bacterium]